jgi:prefoldin subunit 5
MSDLDEISAAIAGIRSRLDTLASIEADNILIPGGPQERYHAIVEEAYAALGLIETQIDELRAELEYQHKRLDEIRDAALVEAMQEKKFGVDAEDAGRRAHEDWANDE